MGHIYGLRTREMGTATKLRANDGFKLGTFKVGKGPVAVKSDGVHVWIANRGDNTVTCLHSEDGSGLRTVTVGSGPAGIAFDGSNIWVANRGDDTVTEIRISDGVVVRTKSIFDQVARWRKAGRIMPYSAVRELIIG